MADKAEDIVAGLGGAGNILHIEPCATRLRIEVRGPSLVDTAALKKAGAYGVLASGRVVQVVVGTEADTLAGDIEDCWSDRRPDLQSGHRAGRARAGAGEMRAGDLLFRWT